MSNSPSNNLETWNDAVGIFNDNLDLLPPNATLQEREMSQTVARLSGIPETPNNWTDLDVSTPIPPSDAASALRNLWNVENCPSAMLPWLAWTFSVGAWSSEWNDATKRATISNAVKVHKTKGSIGSIKEVINSFISYGLSVQYLTEWWQTSPQGTPGTFSIILNSGALPSGLLDSLTQALISVIPARCQFTISFAASAFIKQNSVAQVQAWNFKRIQASI